MTLVPGSSAGRCQSNVVGVAPLPANNDSVRVEEALRLCSLSLLYVLAKIFEDADGPVIACILYTV